jgi:hypothetical protein
MPDCGPVSPALLKTILELDGYAIVIDEPSYWVLARYRQGTPLTIITPIILPRIEHIVPADAVLHVLRKAGISDRRYVQLVEIVSAARRVTALMN